MALIRIRALEILQTAIECAVPELTGRVCAGWAKHPHQQQHPSLAITSARARYFPDQVVEHSIPSPSSAVYNFGRMEATVQLRLGAANIDQRYILEDKIICGIFFQDSARPGIFKANIPDCEGALVVWELETGEWEDEYALENRWQSVLEATLQFPVLARHNGVYSMQEVCLQFTEELDTQVSLIPATDIETTTINGS